MYFNIYYVCINILMTILVTGKYLVPYGSQSLIYTTQGDKAWLAKSRSVSHDWLHCAVVCVTHIAKYVISRNTASRDDSP